MQIGHDCLYVQCHLEHSIAVWIQYTVLMKSHWLWSHSVFCSAQSNFVNKSRLKILQTRQAHLEELFNETRNKLQEISVDQDKYTRLLKDLILEVYTSLVSLLLCGTSRDLNIRICPFRVYMPYWMSPSLLSCVNPISILSSRSFLRYQRLIMRQQNKKLT